MAGDRRRWPGVQSSDRDSERSPGRAQGSCLHLGSTVEAKRDRVITMMSSQVGNPLLMQTHPERKLRPDSPSIGQEPDTIPNAMEQWSGHFGLG